MQPVCQDSDGGRANNRKPMGSQPVLSVAERLKMARERMVCLFVLRLSSCLATHTFVLNDNILPFALQIFARAVSGGCTPVFWSSIQHNSLHCCTGTAAAIELLI